VALDLGPDVVDAILFDRGEPIGALVLPEEQLPRIGETIRRNVGWEYARARQVSPRVYDLTAALGGEQPEAAREGAELNLAEPCTEEMPRGCQLTIGLGRIQELAHEAGVETPELDRLLSQGEATEAQAQAAAAATIERMPCGGQRYEGEIWYDVVGHDAACLEPWHELPPSTCPPYQPEKAKV
jgi:hypothetical protein